MPRSMCRVLRAWRTSILAASPLLLAPPAFPATPGPADQVAAAALDQEDNGGGAPGPVEALNAMETRNLLHDSVSRAAPAQAAADPGAALDSEGRGSGEPGPAETLNAMQTRDLLHDSVSRDGPGQAVSGRVPAGGGGVEDLLLDVVVNGRPRGLIGDFEERGGRLFATRRDLLTLGFLLPQAMRSGDPSEVLPLDGLAGLTYRMDRQSQTVSVTAAATALSPTILGGDDEAAASRLPVESGFGVVLNYDLVGTVTSGRPLGQALFDGRLFTPWGVADSAFSATNAEAAGVRHLVRLDSNFTVSDPGALIQYRAGDVIAGGLAWTRPVRLGGGQITTDFATRPDLVTFPVPTIAGEVAVPSSVDVLVNGVQALSQPVPPGPFEIRQLPVVTGADDVSVVVRNAAGQQTTETLPLYASRLLLQPGLSDFSLEGGPVRLNFGTESDDYRAAAGSASYRYGLFSWLTLEGHAEGAAGGGSYEGLKTLSGGMGGGGAAFTVGHIGTLSADMAGSRFGGLQGGLVSAAFERIAPVFSLSGSIQAASGGYRDVAAIFGDPVSSLQARASIGFSLPILGSLGIAYVIIRRPAARSLQSEAAANAASTPEQAGEAGFDGVDAVALVPASKVSLLSASLSRPIFGGRVNVYLTGFHDFAQASSSGFTGGVSFALGPRSSGAILGSAGDGASAGTIQAGRSAPTNGDTGYQLIEGAGEQSRQLAVGTYRSPWGTVDAGVDVVDGRTSIRADAQGALAFTDGSLFASNTIYDSFAVVDTGAPGIGVLQENRPYGRTDASGKLLVTDLRAFDANRVAIDPEDVPVDADVGETSRLVRPQDRSGVVVRFPIRSSRGAVVRLSDGQGVPIAMGSVAQLEAAGAMELVVGYDGEVFVTGLQAHNVLKVRPVDAARCTARFDYAPVAGALPDIGPVRCVAGR